jgi:hypothetical protein
MIKYIKFFLPASFFVVLAYCAAIKADMFATGFVSVPAIIYCTLRLIISGFKACGNIDSKYNATRAISSLLLIVLFGHALIFSNHGLSELTSTRKQIIKDLKPVFIEYHSDKGHYPISLEDLVPNYIEAIPEELINNGDEDPYKRISYDVADGGPEFSFRTIRGPDSAASLNVITGEYWQNQ